MENIDPVSVRGLSFYFVKNKPCILFTRTLFSPVSYVWGRVKEPRVQCTPDKRG